MKKLLALSLIFGLIICSALIAQAARVSEAKGKTEKNEAGTERKVTIDFRDVDLKIVAKFISELLGKNFIFDRQVQGKVTVYSPSKVSPDEAYRLFESVLEVHGFTTVPYGKYIKIIPSLKARTKAIETRGKVREMDRERDRMVTQLVRLKYASAMEVRKLLTPLLGKTGVMMSYDIGNLIIITDFASNISRLLGIIKAIDVESQASQFSLIPLKHASARDLASELEQLLRAKGKPPQPQTIFIVADQRTNTLIVSYKPGQLQILKRLVKQLDSPAPRGADKIHVYSLENAMAEDLAKVLSSLAVGSQSATTAKPQQGAQRRVLLQEPITIVADRSTNSLIIRAETQDYQILKAIIEKLDVQRAQVLVEGIIMELTLRKTLELGAEWRLLNPPSSDSDETTIFSGTSLSGLLGQMSVAPLASPSGIILGAAKGSLTFGGVSFLNISLLARALESDSEIDILSTPHLLTMDNEEATIIVGQERPFLKTSQTTDTGALTRTFEFQDLGITLRITPHTSKGKFVKLKLFLQIKNFVDEAETGAVTSTKRETETTVMVADGETVVIGGLIRDDTRRTKSSVPCLGQTPLLGWLFKTETDGGDKTNLLILLKPTIIRDTGRLRTVTEEKQEQAEDMRKAQEIEKKERYKKTLEMLQR
ncbi:MAG: type II secretion system secretin GspD [Deltaproteobacteria bacterium]|nr:type II secretion system secretin GspD [Deltaproteobacteria bacterium]